MPYWSGWINHEFYKKDKQKKILFSKLEFLILVANWIGLWKLWVKYTIYSHISKIMSTRWKNTRKLDVNSIIIFLAVHLVFYFLL